MIRRLFAHTSVYTVGTLLTTIAGLISFPIFTRLFSVDEYGLISLISAMLLFLVGFAKLGMQHSTVRFHGDVRVGDHAVTPASYYSTVLLGMSAVAVLVAAAWAVITQALPAETWNDPRMRGLMLFTAALVLIRATDSAFVNILRAQERSLAFTVYAVAKRYGTLAVILLTVFFLLPGLDGFYAATIAVEGVALATMFLYLRRSCTFAASEFSMPLYRSMMAFGLPMVAYELGGVAMALSDRFVIQHFIGSAPLGLYSAAYNLCEYVQAIVLASIGQAIVPMYVRLWRERGAAETRRFISESLHYYIMLGAAVVAGLAALGSDLLVLLASEKYREGARIIPLVAAGMVINGGTVFFGAAFYLEKQSRTLMYLVVGCAVLNFLMNLVMVPRFGIDGAAIATLVSYTALAALTLVMGRRILPIDFPWLQAAKFSALAGAMYLVVDNLHVEGGITTLLLQVLAGVVFYGLLVLMFDTRCRDAAASLIRRARTAP